jgi:hypothetical protein
MDEKQQTVLNERQVAVLDDILATTLTQWFKQRTDTIRRWVDEEKIMPVDPQAFLYMIWTTTQHYAEKNLFFVSSRFPKWSYSKERKTFEEMKEMYNAPMIGRNDVYWVSMETFYSMKPRNIK